MRPTARSGSYSSCGLLRGYLTFIRLQENVPKENSAPPDSDFQTTHWSEVLAAGQEESPRRYSALCSLCKGYWYPLYAFARRLGRNPQDAEDLTQEFFALLLSKPLLSSAQPQYGRFRSFLLASMKNFLSNDWDRKHSIKRGGKCKIISWEDLSAEHRYLREPAHEQGPEKLYEQSWALTTIESAMERLRADYAAAGKDQLFEAIHSFLSEEGLEDSYAALSARLGMTEGAIKMAVLRLRERFRHGLRAQIAQTVASPREIDDELRQLFACLGR